MIIMIYFIMIMIIILIIIIILNGVLEVDYTVQSSSYHHPLHP